MKSICANCKNKDECRENMRAYDVPNVRIDECKAYEEKKILNNDRDCEKCIHRVPYLDKEEGVWRATCEVFNCQFLDRDEVLNAYMGREK